VYSHAGSAQVYSHAGTAQVYSHAGTAQGRSTCTGSVAEAVFA